MDSLLLILNSFGTAFSLFASTWWIYLPIFFYALFSLALKNYTNLKFRLSLEWTLLEIKFPKETHKSPKAMEQIFAGLHGVYTVPVKWHEKVFKGKMLDWFSFEMIGRGGETHFYIRTQTKYKNVVEAQIYAQYPDAEVIEVPDYVNDLPLSLPDEKYDLWGIELLLNKEDAYPIRTYPDFEEKGGRGGPDEDVKRIDPLASLSELFSTLHAGEQIWIQIIGTPVSDDWTKRGQQTIDKIMGKTPEAPKGNILSDILFSVDKAISGMAAAPAGELEDIKVKEPKKERVELSPGKQETLKAIEKSLDKVGYETGIRFIYIGPRDNFHQTHVAGINGAFRQFSSQNLNGFRGNAQTVTHTKGLFKKTKLMWRKNAIFQNFRERKVMVIRYVLNIEELATIFHFPDVGVRSPLLPRVEAKKGEPPVGLPLA